MANEVCFRTLHLPDPGSLASYRSIGGYDTLKRLVTEKFRPRKSSTRSRFPACAAAVVRVSPPA
jgi:hypothetical protein